MRSASSTIRFEDADGGAPDDNIVEITAGGTVDFSYETGNSSHNAKFDQAPTSCEQTEAPEGYPILPAPPLPVGPMPPGWAGICTFNTPGEYTFVCSLIPRR